MEVIQQHTDNKKSNNGRILDWRNQIAIFEESQIEDVKRGLADD